MTGQTEITASIDQDTRSKVTVVFPFDIPEDQNQVVLDHMLAAAHDALSDIQDASGR